MAQKINITHTANCRDRTEDIRYIILHCSSYSPDRQLDMLDKYGLSTHYIVSERGQITENCPPDKVAYHAGESSWLGSEGKSLNGCSIGVELESFNLGQTPQDYSSAQISALCRLLRQLVFAYRIRRENILGHSDIAPKRKADPGAGFPWQKLYSRQLVLWPSLKSLSPEASEEELLKAIGYDTGDLTAARYAFCRHFFPREVAVRTDVHSLLDEPYPKDFAVRDREGYMRMLRAAAYAFQTERKKKYWYLNG